MQLHLYMFLLENSRLNEDGELRSYVYELTNKLGYKRGKNKRKKCHLQDHTVMTLEEFFECCKSLHKKKWIKKWNYKIHVHGNGGSMDLFQCEILNWNMELIEVSRRTLRERNDIRLGFKELEDIRKCVTYEYFGKINCEEEHKEEPKNKTEQKKSSQKKLTSWLRKERN